jgi:hypothetical protein
VAPQTLASLLLSVFLNLLITEIPAFWKKWHDKSATPFSVTITSGLNLMIKSQTALSSVLSCSKALALDIIMN